MKLGKIRVSSELYEKISKDQFTAHVFNRIFGVIVPLYIKDKRITDRYVWYYCFYEKWKDLKEGEAVPEYFASITENGVKITT